MTQDESRPGAAEAARPETAIYEALHAAILDNRLPAGTRLVEDQLARAWGVSRARIRLVLQALAREHMVTLQHNRGAFVSFPSPDEAQEVFQARRMIEASLMREVARRLTPEDFPRLAEHIARETQAHLARDRRASIKLSGEFHLLLAQIAGNRTVTGFLAQLIARSSLALAVYERPGSSSCSLTEHHEVIGALMKGDAEAAVQTMDAHLAELQARLALDRVPHPAELDIAALFGLRPHADAREPSA